MTRDVPAQMLGLPSRVWCSLVVVVIPVCRCTNRRQLSRAWRHVSSPGHGLGASSPAVVDSLRVVSLPVRWVLAGDAGVDASYGGSAYPDSGTDAGLGVDGVASLFLPWLCVT